MRRFFIIAAMLALLVPATWLLQQFKVAQLERNVEERQERLTNESAHAIERDFDQILTELRDRATAAASDQDAWLLLSERTPGTAADLATVAAIRRFRGRHDAGVDASTELFDENGKLVAWSGFSVLPPPASWPPPVDGWATVEADPYRKCLVMWYPVGSQGLVRVVQVAQLLQSGTRPAENEDLGVRWTRMTGQTVDVLLNDSTSTTMARTNQVTLIALINEAGDTLGEARLSVPSVASLIREGARRFGDIQAVWFILLMGWVFSGLWKVVDGMARADLRSLSAAAAVAGLRLGLILGLRFGLLALNLPGRWFRDSWLSALFDPVNLASSVAGGVARSAGDLLITGFFVLAAALAVLDVVLRYSKETEDSRPPRLPALLAFGLSTVVTGIIWWHALLTRRAMLDATLDFFAWTGLAPEPLVLVVFCSLLLSTIAAILLSGSLFALGLITCRLPLENRRTRWTVIAASIMPPVIAFGLGKLEGFMPIWLFAAYVAVSSAVAIFVVNGRIGRTRSLRFRPIVAAILVAATLLYPLVYLGMDAHRRLRIVDVAEDFVERSDEQAIANATTLLGQMAASEDLNALLRKSTIKPTDWTGFARSLPAADIVPGIVSARVTLFDVAGRPLGGYEENGSGSIRVIPATLATPGVVAGDSVQAPRVDVLRNRRSGESRGYAGVAPVRDSTGTLIGLLTARFDRHIVSTPFGSLFGYSDWRRSLSLAEFRDGVRVRNEGEDFERYTLPIEVVQQLQEKPEVWRNESIYGRAHITYYARVGASGRLSEAGLAHSQASDVVAAVRARAVIPYDHLYYLLRMALSGLWFGLPIFLIGAVFRWRRGDLPAKRTQIGDRVLDAFMVVGTLAVLIMGLVGQQVITRENEGAIRSRLQRRLDRVETALQQAARADEPLFEVQQRLPLDSLASDLSLDLNVYRGPWLTDHSQTGPDVLPLMGYRLPPSAYDDLFLKRFRQSFVESTGQYGFVYTIGYKALMDEEGNPVSVVAVLTAPEQERIREERARTTAYFFGALLILLLIILGTATVLASALAGPITRLRDGLRGVAEGRFQRPIPVDSRDEVGELVETFNLMQSQLAESRRRLAQQERELAWREMARQVAHEIKNPLTPMKLSIQHLQRAFEEGNGSVNPEFEQAFRRITKTVSEQIETLANIANEFSTFARMPKRHLEHLDVNEIVREAISLLQEETGIDVILTTEMDPAIVEADRDELRRVFINLIKNAQQATHERGTVSVLITRGMGVQDQPNTPVVVTEIIDTGSGISEEVRDKIFQPNFSTKTSGMGLGLAIAKKSVEDVRGEIGFTTREGEGSTFWIRLPGVE